MHLLHVHYVLLFREEIEMQKPGDMASMKIIDNVQKKIEGWEVRVIRCDTCIQCTFTLLCFSLSMSLTPAFEWFSICACKIVCELRLPEPVHFLLLLVQLYYNIMPFYIHELVAYSVQGSDLGQCCTEFIMGKCIPPYCVYFIVETYVHTLYCIFLLLTGSYF